MELLRRVPYIQVPGDDARRIQSAADCYSADYRSGSYEAYLRDGDGETIKTITEGLDCDDVPAHVVGLIRGGRDDLRLLLDTHVGTSHEVVPLGRKNSTPESRDIILSLQPNAFLSQLIHWDSSNILQPRLVSEPDLPEYTSSDVSAE
jgi:hypothetical protein